MPPPDRFAAIAASPCPQKPQSPQVSLMRLFYVLLLAAVPGAACAEPLTFDEALVRASAQAPSLQAKALEVDAHRSSAIAAGQLPDPKLGVGVENFPISGPPAFTFGGDNMSMIRLGISQEVPNGAKRHARTGRAQA